jgi:hypothetical protein
MLLTQMNFQKQVADTLKPICQAGRDDIQKVKNERPDFKHYGRKPAG